MDKHVTPSREVTIRTISHAGFSMYTEQEVRSVALGAATLASPQLHADA
jgi:hypothetical protein